ncbi:MAG: permease [Bacteroidales bacterium]|nr:permease [Bacteroidales bacterium]
MEWKKELKIFAWILGFFLFAYFMPIGTERFNNALLEAFELTKWYAQEHVLLCLVPAFFIAGVIAVFVSQGAVIKYFGAKAKKWKAYLIASLSGTILAVCSCTILPLFSSIHKRGAGLGPAITFLYSGPAINILAIILTARILGFELGIARIIGAVVFSVIIGIIMSLIYRKEEKKRAEKMDFPDVKGERPLWQTAYHFFALVLILVFANWGKPDTNEGFMYWLYAYKWQITAFFGLMFIYSLIKILKMKPLYVILAAIPVIATAFIFPAQPLIPFVIAVVGLTILTMITPGESQDWLRESWGFTKQIMPLLAAGVLIAGLLLGTVDGEGIIPSEWVSSLVGGNSILSNFFASIFGAFMYFATLTEIPIIQGLLNNGMGQGPALALLLAGPALSLPNMLVIRSVIGTQKTIVYVILVSIMATISGLIYGAIV